MHEQMDKGNFDPKSQLLILDGIPRTVEQAKHMEPLIEVLGVVHLAAMDKEAMIQRLQQRALKQKRADDAKEEVVRNRLDVYERETRPVLDLFDASVVHEIDAMGTMASVLAKVLTAVAPIQAKHL
jgi:adenylate kinase